MHECHLQQHFHKWKLHKGIYVDMMTALTLQEEGIREKVKQYPVPFDKQLKGCWEKDVATNACNAVAKEIEFIENGKSI